MNRTLRAALGKLRQAEAGQLAGSTLSAAQRKTLEHFARQTGSVQIRPSGRGVIYVIVEAAIVERHWRDLTPIDPEQLADDVPDRAANIATSRSSKSARHDHPVHYLLLKAGPGPVSWRDDRGHRLDLRQATDQQGAGVLAIHSDSHWASDGPLWLVENQALFDRLDWLPDSNNCSVGYYSGQLRTGLLDWLAERPRASQLHFFPDYDGVGLLNYARIRARLGADVSLWLMPDWQSRLSRFGSPVLWRRSAREFRAAQQQLSTLTVEPEIQQLMRAMQRQGLALEQEAVWLQT